MIASSRLRSGLPVLLVLAIAGTPLVASAQPVELPTLSPRAKVEQRVGVTDFSIEYSSPAVKGRKIWVDVVPFDKVWRAGANAPTKLTASRDFNFGKVAVKAGSYSIFMIPGKASWSVHLNSDLAAGQNNHDPKKDVAKVVVKPIAAPLRERMLFVFDNTTDGGTSLELEWERVRIEVPITVDTKAHVNATIYKITTEAGRPQLAAANYLNEAGEVDRALVLVEKSLAIQPTWRAEWLRAQIFKKKGKVAEAVAGAKRAQTMGANDPIYEQFFKADIAKAVTGWK
jgi:hypothetical protein